MGVDAGEVGRSAGGLLRLRWTELRCSSFLNMGWGWGVGLVLAVQLSPACDPLSCLSSSQEEWSLAMGKNL